MRSIRGLALLLVVCLGGPARAADDLVPLRAFASAGHIETMKISPDGRWVTGIGYADTRVVYLTELDTSRTTLVAEWQRDSRYLFGAAPVAVSWIGNDLLAVDYDTRESVSIDLTGKRIAKLGERFIR